MRIRSFRFKLQASFVALGLLAISVTGWQAWVASASALRKATDDRLTAIRETKRQLLETYFLDVSNHVLALSSDEATVTALQALRTAHRELPPALPESPAWQRLRMFYQDQFAPTIADRMLPDEVMQRWFPHDPRTVTLQDAFIANNPHPLGAKDMLLEPRGLGAYGATHARFHPTFHRYQTAFGFYDIFLIDALDGVILYSVFKETDFGMSLNNGAYATTALAKVYRAALELEQPELVVMEDYAPYMASHLAPAAFVAAPIWRAGAKAGVLVIQVSATAIDRVLSGSANWRNEGLGETGNVYLVGADGLLRSDHRFLIEDSGAFLTVLAKTGIDPVLIDRIRRNRTSILNLSLDPPLMERLRSSEAGTEIGTDFRGAEVFRAYTQVAIPWVKWRLVAEMSTKEALEPLRLLTVRTVTAGAVIAALFLASAWWLAGFVTEPVLRLAEGARRLGQRDFGVHLPVTSYDELGELAEAFNRMATDLDRTTVSRDELDIANHELRSKRAELEVLAERLIQAQEVERARLARELHDDFTQRIAALAIRAGRLKNLEGEARMAALQVELEAIQKGLSRLGDDVHGLSRRLHPSILDELGLVAAIESECRGFFERGGPVVDFQHSGDFAGLPPDTQRSFYRIVQESLRNIFRHADATEVEIQLRHHPGACSLSIRDNGRGFQRDDPDWKAGIGLVSMGERARLLGGTCDIASSPGEGTTITITIPDGHDIQTENV
ncbi:MAG: HAMP domain-containing protein [Bryobacterales bacterium]|nr:HAMP domain-containing protein [Bryobacterales bacterium]